MVKTYDDLYGKITLDSTGVLNFGEFGSTPNGFCYKSLDAWKAGDIAYISEHDSFDAGQNADSFECCTREKAFRYAKELLKSEGLDASDERAYALADEAFEDVDWQYMSTRMQELLENI